MRVFTLHPGHGTAPVRESDTLPTALPSDGFLWISCTRTEFEAQLAAVQGTLQNLAGQALFDLHVSDLLNRQLPSHYDYTSEYDIVVFRRLASAAGPGSTSRTVQAPSAAVPSPTSAPAPVRLFGTGKAGASSPLLAQVDTSAVGFAVYDRVVLTVHPSDCLVRDAYAARLLQAASGLQVQGGHGVAGGNGHAHGPAGGNGNGSGSANGGPDHRVHQRLLPASPADLMLRMISSIIDGFLELRRDLSQQIDNWQLALLNPGSNFSDWRSLLASRMSLHQLDEICEDQRAALQDWLDALEAWPDTGTAEQKRERELLKVRSRDVLEHIERVVHHVRRMEQNAETAVQIHFSLQSNRANDIMRTLTVLTAIFLPLNLIAGIFGMNFDFLPLVHRTNGFWLAMGTMLAAALGLTAWFWRRRYLNRQDADN
ncbi:magnesium transporter CorA family protein [Comamonas sp. BIGb0124]|uniref:magnesium transporter CorA family protein n=1 Tax=Comamonas sp. BIGb0124 TaxID=2485130 RepID=UPI000F48B5A6|nr:magnesium transporter CorA family protein [Comamonas sp. BIGb0124]